MAGETLEQRGLARIDAEVMELDPRPRPGQRGGTLEGRGIAVLVDNVEQRLARGSGHGPERNMNDRAGRDPHTAAQGKDWIEHNADRVRERPTIDHRDRPSDAIAASEETGPVGLDLLLTDGFTVDDGEMSSPDFVLCRPTPSAGRQDGTDVGEIFGLYEQLGKRRMRIVGGLACQHQLGIGGDIDLSRGGAGIRDRNTSNLGIVFRRNEHFHGGRERSVTAREFGPIFIEDDLIGVGLDAARLNACRPHIAAANVSQEDVGAPVIASGVLAPPGHRQIPPATVARAGGREHDRIAAVRDEVRGRRRAVCRGEPPAAQRLDPADLGSRLRFGRPGTSHRHVTRRALLQKQLRRLDDGLGMEPRPHRAIQQAHRRWRRSSYPDGAP